MLRNRERRRPLKLNGGVIAISSDSMTIRPGRNTMVFIIDKATKVTGKGGGTPPEMLMKAQRKLDAQHVSNALPLANDGVRLGTTRLCSSWVSLY